MEETMKNSSTSLPVIPAKAGIWRSITAAGLLARRIPAFAGMTMVALALLVAPLSAAEKPAAPPKTEKPAEASKEKNADKAPAWLATGKEFSPEGCEFTVMFPEAPYKTKRCDPVEPDKNCSEVTSFTKVFGMDATVDYRVTCIPADPAMYDKYDNDVMRTALIAMAKPANLDKSETGFGELKEAKMAVLLGSGKTDNKKDDLIYTAQLWIGHKSVFTLEGELRGKYVAEADQMFADILKTAKVKGPVTQVVKEEKKTESAKEEKAKAEEKPKADDKEKKPAK
jgi:hypothetical protein